MEIEKEITREEVRSSEERSQGAGWRRHGPDE